MYCRGISGATTTKKNTAKAGQYKEGLKADSHLLSSMILGSATLPALPKQRSGTPNAPQDCKDLRSSVKVPGREFCYHL